MTREALEEVINKIVQRDGYFCMAWYTPRKIGESAQLSFLEPSMGDCLIIGEATHADARRQWGRRWNICAQFPYVYRVMVD